MFVCLCRCLFVDTDVSLFTPAVMEVSPQDPVAMAMDLSKGFSSLSRSHAEAVDLAKKPEWYHRRPPSCTADSAPPYRSRASSSYSLLSTQPGGAVHCRDMEESPEDLRGYMNSTLAPRLDLYHDGARGDLWHAGFYGTDRSGGTAPESTGGEESDSGSDVIFLVSSPKERLLCGSFIQDGVRHMVEPLSPAASSLDEGRGCFLLPQHMSSPSADTSYSEDSSDSSVDIPVRHARPTVLLSDFRAAYANRADSADASSDDSDVIEVSVTNGNRETPESCQSTQNGEVGSPQEEVHHRLRTRKVASERPPTRGAVLRRSLKRRVKNVAVGIYNESCDSDKLMEYALKLSSSEDSDPPDLPQSSVCGSEESDRADAETPQRKQRPPGNASRSKNRTPKAPLMQRNLLEKDEQRLKQKVPPPQNHDFCKRTKPPSRRKRKRRSLSGPPAPFPLEEPEIQLKYAKTKGERKHRRSSFCPFVHMEPRRCRVVNYEEEEEPRSSRGAPPLPAAASLSGFLPSSSCFQLGRHSSAGGFQAAPLCCLCGQTANATNLGDLHGPYCPAGPAKDCEEHRDGCVDGAAAEGSHPPTDGPLNPEERWIHEDCGIWSAGVFLVRGKLYGLEEAARLARETVCSACQKTGAVVGCFQKGCSRSYHYPCALQSGTGHVTAGGARSHRRRAAGAHRLLSASQAASSTRRTSPCDVRDTRIKRQQLQTGNAEDDTESKAAKFML
uniref:PHD-type domain-containing protein n=1 Tax=Oryzias sinensis TaxID=183150 RepID=A0A8C7XP59_9TELE